MLKIVIEPGEIYDEKTNEFRRLDKSITLSLEHSLLSLSKWESIWHKPYNDPRTPTKTRDESVSYIKCMVINQNFDDDIFYFLTDYNVEQINKYISDTMTATWFSEDQSKGNAGRTNEIITSELIYYWMINYNIPFECQKWHLNRLLTLIRVCSVKNQENEKKSNGSRKDVNTNAAAAKNLNAKRRAAMKKH